MKKDQNINDNPRIKILSVATILYINVLLISIFALYFRNKFNVTSPLIPKEKLIDVSFEQYAVKGLMLSCGLPILVLLKVLKKNFAVVVVSAIMTVIYTFFSLDAHLTTMANS